MPSENNPFWVFGVKRTIIDHPEEVSKIRSYLLANGDLRVNTKKVELLWQLFSEISEKSVGSFRDVTDDSLREFAIWLESGTDDWVYAELEQRYADWEKSPNKLKEVPM